MSMSPRMARVCGNLRVCRALSGLTLDQVAVMTGGLDGPTLAAIERGERAPSLYLACDLAHVYNVSIDALVGLEPLPNTRAPVPAPAPVRAAPTPVRAPPAPALQRDEPPLPTLKITPELFAAVTVYAEEHGRRVGEAVDL